MALILLASKRFETFWTGMRINAMQHENTVFHGPPKAVPIKGTPYLIHTLGCDTELCVKLN